MATAKELGRLRYWLEELNAVRKARDVYYKLADEFFVKAVAMIVTTLWSRYRHATKDEESPMSFVLWLNERKTLENTYNRRFELKTRRRWSVWQIQNVTNKILTFSPDLYDQYGFRGRFRIAFMELVNLKQPESPWDLIVEIVDIPEELKPHAAKELNDAQKRRLTIPGGASLRFEAELRFALEDDPATMYDRTEG